MSGRVGIVTARRGVVYGSTRAEETGPLPAGRSGRERLWLAAGLIIPGISEEWHIVRLDEERDGPVAQGFIAKITHGRQWGWPGPVKSVCGALLPIVAPIVASSQRPEVWCSKNDAR